MNRNHQILGSRAPSVPAAPQTLPKTSVKSGASIVLVLPLALFCLAASGCGQKGPLYLPAPTASTPTAPDAPTAPTAPSTDSR